MNLTCDGTYKIGLNKWLNLQYIINGHSNETVYYYKFNMFCSLCVDVFLCCYLMFVGRIKLKPEIVGCYKFLIWIDAHCYICSKVEHGFLNLAALCFSTDVCRSLWKVHFVLLKVCMERNNNLLVWIFLRDCAFWFLVEMSDTYCAVCYASSYPQVLKSLSPGFMFYLVLTSYRNVGVQCK